MGKNKDNKKKVVEISKVEESIEMVKTAISKIETKIDALPELEEIDKRIKSIEIRLETIENTLITPNNNEIITNEKDKNEISQDNNSYDENEEKIDELGENIEENTIDKSIETKDEDADNNKTNEEDKPKKKFNIGKCHLIKLFFSIIITIIAAVCLKEYSYIACGIAEIGIIFIITDFINKKHHRIAYAFNSVFNLLYNFEVGLLFFSSSFISRIMITNLNSIEDLAGKGVIYIIAAIIVIIISFLKINKESLNIDLKIKSLILVLFIIIEILSFILLGNRYSPFYGYISLIDEEIRYNNLKKMINQSDVDKDFFYKDDVSNYIDAKHNLGEKPNIILIFTEGLSQNVILDNRDIMPNVREYEEKSINFTGYYNHTFATYRGLIGQLYSGYQNENFDRNSLISLQSILKDKGYNTCFINTEPKNKDFTRYIKDFGFDDVVSTKTTAGVTKTLSDRQAYEELIKQGEKLNKNEKPFFLAVYTFGTHVSLDSTDEKYKNGNSSILNRFYNLDYQFGKFIKMFEGSKLYDNTMIVFTADHCTYNDLDYKTAFGDSHERSYTMLDDMPLFIYHKGIEHEDIEVNGRNTLCLAPTILDYIDISAPNYFLGSSLFSRAQSNSELEYTYQSEVNFCTSKDKNLVTENWLFDDELKEKIYDYFSICSQ